MQISPKTYLHIEQPDSWGLMYTRDEICKFSVYITNQFVQEKKIRCKGDLQNMSKSNKYV